MVIANVDDSSEKLNDASNTSCCMGYSQCIGRSTSAMILGDPSPLGSDTTLKSFAYGVIPPEPNTQKSVTSGNGYA